MTDIEWRLENWGICQRVTWRRGHCQSAEHHYLPERIVGEAWETKQAPKPVLDHKDAEVVEEAWRKLAERRHKNLLRLAYIWRAPPGFICRRLGLQNDKDGTGYLLELGRAHRAIKRLLEASSMTHSTIA